MIINQIVSGGGTTPTGTKQITTNGIHDVAAYANADVQVPTTAPAYYIEKTVDANGKLKNSTSMISFNNVTDLSNYIFYGQYYGVTFPNNTSIDMSSLTNITGTAACQSMFASCTGITSVDLSALTTVSGTNACNLMFDGCSGITSVDLSSLTTISGLGAFQSMFSNCRGLTSVDLSSLTTVTGNNSCQLMFNNCSDLTSVNLNGLNSIRVLATSYAPMFQGCVKLESVTFGGLTAATFTSATNQIQYLFNNITGRDAPNGCTIHFPSNFDPSDPNHTFDASTLTGYPTFGGSSSYIHVAFDLPATE